MHDASRCRHCYVLWSVLAESPLAPPSIPSPPECGSSPLGFCPVTFEAMGAPRLRDALERLSLTQCSVVSVGELWVWAELWELPYCFESVVSNSGLEHVSAVLSTHRPDWLVPATWCSDQWSPGVLSPCVLGVPPQYDSNLANDGPSMGGDVGDEGVVGWDLGLACTIWIPPMGIIRQGTLACWECMGRWLKMLSGVWWPG